MHYLETLNLNLGKLGRPHVTLQDNEKKILSVVVTASPNKRNVNDN